MSKKRISLHEALEKRGAKIDESQKAFIESMNDEINSVLDEHESELERRSSDLKENLKASIESKIKELGLSADLATELREISEKIETVEKGGFSLGGINKRLLSAVIEERKSEIVDAIKGKSELDLFAIRVAAPHQNNNGTISLGTIVGSATTTSIPLVENWDDSDVIATFRTPENYILELISTREVAKVVNTRIKTEQAPKEGDFALVTETNAKPLVQYKFVKNAIERIKVAGHIEWSEEFEIDNGLLMNAIYRLIEEDILKKLNYTLYAKIIALATPYTSSPSDAKIILPNTNDVATVLGGIINCQGFSANYVMLNCGDVTNLLLTKKADGTYIINPLVTADGRINGMRIISTPTVGAGNILVMDSSIFKIEKTKVSMRVGTINDQLIKNMFTLVAETFAILDVNKIDLTGAMYGSIATIATALTKTP
jgi:hypothetical protein